MADLARAVRFYRVLGLRPVGRTLMKDGTRIVWMSDPSTGQLLELFHLSPRSPLFRPLRRRTGTENALIFGVEDAPDLVRRLRRLGARVEAEFEEDLLRFTFVRDPDGTWIELLAWTDASRSTHRDLPLMHLVSAARAKKSRAR